MLQIFVRVESDYSQPIVLHARNWRFKSIALEARSLSLGLGNPLLPATIGTFLAWFDPGRDHRGDRHGHFLRPVTLDKMNVIPSDDNRLHIGGAGLSSFRIEPSESRRAVSEMLQDHPVHLGRGVGRYDCLPDEAGKTLENSTGFCLPRGECLGLIGGRIGLRDDCGASAAHSGAVSSAKMRSGVKGRCAKRTPTASAIALATAGATGFMAHSPCDFAPSGPTVSKVSANNTSVCGTSAKAGM